MEIRKIKVVVVDTGVDITHKLLNKYSDLNGIGLNFPDELINFDSLKSFNNFCNIIVELTP